MWHEMWYFYITVSGRYTHQLIWHMGFIQRITKDKFELCTIWGWIQHIWLCVTTQSKRGGRVVSSVIFCLWNTHVLSMVSIVPLSNFLYQGNSIKSYKTLQPKYRISLSGPCSKECCWHRKNLRVLYPE